jgi:hypothetical protein
MRAAPTPDTVIRLVYYNALSHYGNAPCAPGSFNDQGDLGISGVRSNQPAHAQTQVLGGLG